MKNSFFSFYQLCILIHVTYTSVTQNYCYAVTFLKLIKYVKAKNTDDIRTIVAPVAHPKWYDKNNPKIPDITAIDIE